MIIILYLKLEFCILSYFFRYIRFTCFPINFLGFRMSAHNPECWMMQGQGQGISWKESPICKQMVTLNGLSALAGSYRAITVHHCLGFRHPSKYEASFS